MKIIGIDPGSARVGYGVIEKKNNGLRFIRAGLLKISSKDKGKRLLELEKSFSQLLKKEKPDLVVLEKLYFMKNMKTALEVAQSRGVLTLTIIKYKIPLLEYTPLEIKQGVTGYGMADKKSVAKMVNKILKIKKISKYDDMTDALAAAILGSDKIKFGF
ncbi:crossover junction endodeoxyribonuclease RuvC [Candidatus Wolfebacteria bacterium CG18_big_fil_WC_8_21_14_2_50_39_7]|uniref:Crossover junction endodeoxyribonuclease RuvC n=5 Tax=Candidatus Wolfeibacteriota TaxID=1752735 RepID=A0A2M7Q700_9BACT|nr:crossover junction endodeoxyribonuclease RuvC [Parcubacteria group bacterium]NCO89321.1 crossover junction endodeoxyribonuclease RuvC [Candidatus Wolfebacteria bacterium]OIO64471.1 MAG: crossover junction endodeoxyribonuclease RuvC [Candidatus Wolfebacteria bacterium CG1_02_39_135]PIP92014.1 MAG: crossover junction endodeoxyribonuclease RuvC [Candidatus Wolfebacteria bacterium CG18_big_fil_WC_8_21_14_2_50_39_7]PIU98842.1 MAG: crossover junction endodeoxyribonuclease RuvC [Candidatus Wolfebac